MLKTDYKCNLSKKNPWFFKILTLQVSRYIHWYRYWNAMKWKLAFCVFFSWSNFIFTNLIQTLGVWTNWQMLFKRRLTDSKQTAWPHFYSNYILALKLGFSKYCRLCCWYILCFLQLQIKNKGTPFQHVVMLRDSLLYNKLKTRSSCQGKRGTKHEKRPE